MIVQALDEAPVCGIDKHLTQAVRGHGHRVSRKGVEQLVGEDDAVSFVWERARAVCQKRGVWSEHLCLSGPCGG